MIHSFSGSVAQAEQLITLDFMISISASVTFDNAKKAREVVKNIPLTSLLLETDAPDQPDQAHRYERNEPAYMINTLKTIAAIRNDSPETIASQTSINARTLFNL